MDRYQGPSWRPEVRQEVALHRVVKPDALIMALIGVMYDLEPNSFRERARHQPCDQPERQSCPECRRVDRVRQWVMDRCVEVVALPRRDSDSTYYGVRARVGSGAPLRRAQATAIMERFKTSDEQEALTVLLWVVVRLLSMTHRPGALTARWSQLFGDAEYERRRVHQEALTAALAKEVV